MDFSRKWVIYILLLLATISWGASFVAGKYAVGKLHFLAASAMAFVFWYHGVKYLNASKVAVFQNVVPLKYFHMAGGLLIFPGVYTANRKKSEVLDKPANVRLKESG
jgi:drug/metabolite transporter (DMT)-like permease